MNVRLSGYEDYGFTDHEAKEWNKRCLNADKELETIILQAAQESNPTIAVDLFYSLRSGVSYDRIIDWNSIPISRGDFYGYRRKTLYLVKEKLLRQNTDTMLQDSNQPSYSYLYTLEEVCTELNFNRSTVILKAKAAGALLKRGSVYRVDMSKLRSYIAKGKKKKSSKLTEVSEMT